MTIPALVVWFAIAAVGGFTAILGSLMTLGTLLLWLVPGARMKVNNVTPAIWPGRLKLLGVSAAFAIGGLVLLAIMPQLPT